MKKLSLLFGLTFLVSCNIERPVNKVIQDKACFVRGSAIIYGTNNIVDLPTTEDRDLQELSKSVAAMVSSNRLFVDRYSEDKKDEFLFHGDSLAHSYRMCDESLNSQHAGAKCSSFLVDEGTIVTAAHCLIDVNNKEKSPEQVCKSHKFIFDFNDSKFQGDNHHGAIVKKRDVYSCDKVIEYKNDDEHDYAVIKLDRKVEGREPVKLLNPSEMKYGSAVSTLGFPQGLTLRASTDGKFYELSKNRNWLLTQVDSFSGNSGGPIIDELTNMVVGIHTHGLNDALLFDKERSCYTYSTRCSDPTTCGTGYAFNITKINSLKNIIVQNTNIQREEIGCE